jgi:hypothetical protein
MASGIVAAVDNAALIRVARRQANRYLIAAAGALAAICPHYHAPLREPYFDEFL